MLGLITDRTQEDVDRLKMLSAKRWDEMTPSEQMEWMGDPLSITGYGPVNLMANGPCESFGAELVFRNSHVRATAIDADRGLYAVVIIGDADAFEGKTITMSVDEIESDGGTPCVGLYWYDEGGADYAGIDLSEAGTATATLIENTGGRKHLAAYIWATTVTAMGVGDSTTYRGLMIEFGSTRHSYVPYTEIVATPVTKGAYNYSDMNRVERMVAELSEKLDLGLETKTNWSQWDLLTEEDATRYLGNIEVIRNTYTGSAELPAVPGSFNGLDHQKANNIEKILQIIYVVNHPAGLGSMVLGISTIGATEG